LEQLRAAPVLVAPAAEQRSIVATIDALGETSRRAKEALDVIPPLLERFRQSVLASAFRGDLTAEWRAKHPDVEPADKLLQRIRTERRRRWEESELAKLHAKGKTPSDDRWKQKYEEPEPVDPEGLPELPEGWAWASVEELCPAEAPAVYGIIQPGDDVPGGVPYLRPIDIRPDGTINFDSVKRTSPDIAAQYSRASLRTGDIVLSIVGTIGKVVVTPQALDQGNITQSSARLRSPSWMPSEYLRLSLLSPILTRQYDKYRFGNAVQRLNVEHVRRLAVPIAPAGEIVAVIASVAAALQRIPHQAVAQISAHLQQLNRSILAKAFRGDLVPQDPTDEPASVLLDRIRQERAAADLTKAKKPAKRAR
jgi:type I restriction enzyme S subunit